MKKSYLKSLMKSSLKIVTVFMLILTSFSIQSYADATQQGINVTVSSTLASSGWELDKMLDGNEQTQWSSAWINEKNPMHTEWFAMELDDIRKIKKLSLKPRFTTYCFPSDFILQYSVDGEKWINITNQAYKDYKVEDNIYKDFSFSSEVVAKYLRVYVTKRSPDDSGNCLVQIAEVKIDSTEATEAEKAKAKEDAKIAQAFEEDTTSAVSSTPDTSTNATSNTTTSQTTGETTVAEGQGLKITTTSVLKSTGWEVNKMLDNNPATAWSSTWVNEKVADCKESIQIDVKAVKKVISVTLKPQSEGSCFPSEFVFQSSINGQVWNDIPEASYKDYKITGIKDQIFTFTTPVIAQYIKLVVTKRSSNKDGNYLIQIAELRASFTEVTQAEINTQTTTEENKPKPIKFIITASSELDKKDWSMANLNDDDPNTLWSSEWINEKSPSCEEWIQITSGGIAKYISVSLTPRTNATVCFPADFKFQYTLDGDTWIDIEGASYKDYEITDTSLKSFVFKTPIVSESIRIFITKKSADDKGNYLVQLSEVTADIESVTDVEIAVAKTNFNKMINLKADSVIAIRDDTKIVMCIFIGITLLLIIFIILFFIFKRKKIILRFAIIPIILSIAFAFYTSMSVDYVLTAKVGAGKTIYTPENNAGYRYGPSMIIDNKGGIEAWFSMPGSTGVWDVLSYRYSPDGGNKWEDEFVSVRPTADTEDAFSTCDPGVFKMGAYYYAGYTSTINPDGCYNNVYVARAKSPKGPWEKWDGNGWSNNPKPIIFYGSNADAYGIGEPSFIVLNGKIYIYYSYIGKLGNGTDVRQTRLAIAQKADDPNWPNTIKEICYVITGKDATEDSADVKYIDAYKQFIAVTTQKRFSANSRVKMYSSSDGMNFKEIVVDAKATKKRIHNIGITGTPEGHFNINAKNYVGYAYGLNSLEWGNWSTDISPVVFESVKVINLGKPLQSKPKDPTNSKIKDVYSITQASEYRDATMAIDGNINTIWSSALHNRPEYNESIAVGLNNGKSAGIKVTPRYDNICFPLDFKLQYSDDALNWKDIKSQIYTNYSLKSTGEITFKFSSNVKAKYIRLLATKLTADEFGTYAFQLAEIKSY